MRDLLKNSHNRSLNLRNTEVAMYIPIRVRWIRSGNPLEEEPCVTLTGGQTTSVHFIAVHSLRLLQCYKEPTTGSLSTYLRPILTGLESRGKNRTEECYKESSKQIPYLSFNQTQHPYHHPPTPHKKLASSCADDTSE